MKRRFLALVLLLVISAFAGCGGGGGDSHPLFVKQILSDDTVDGDISLDPVTGSLTITQVARDEVPSVFAGVSPSTLDEFRAFLDFPLAGIPLNAIIQSATLDIMIDSIAPANGSIPIRIELVSFPPPLQTTDFSRSALPPLATTTIVPDISVADVGHHLRVDVTALMAAAQFRGLPRFQVRILEDLGPVSPGLVGIDESSNTTAPLLTVVYF